MSRQFSIPTVLRMVPNRLPNRTLLLTQRGLLNGEFESSRAGCVRSASGTSSGGGRMRRFERGRQARGCSRASRLVWTQPFGMQRVTPTQNKNAGAASASAFSVNPWVALFRQPTQSSPTRTRTLDPAVNSRLLYQLSYRGSSTYVSPSRVARQVAYAALG